MSIVLKAAFETLYRSGAATLLRPLTQGLGVIFCMHSVRPACNAEFAPNANLESTPEFLEAAITMLKAQGYDLVSMDEATGRISGTHGKASPFAAFTLDDGYRDNLEYALPVFVRHNCPFMVYVAPGLVDGTTDLWWKALECFIAQQDNLDVVVGGQKLTFVTHTPQQKLLAWNSLAPRIQNLPEFERRDWIRSAASRIGLDLQQQCIDAIMSWDELRGMAKHPLASIGAHTTNHYALKRLQLEDATREIVGSRQRLEHELGCPVRHFAYPYGNVAHAGAREFRIAADAGFTSSVTTRLGTVFAEHAYHMQALPRVMVSGKYQRSRWLQVLATGLPGRLSNTGRRLSVG